MELQEPFEEYFQGELDNQKFAVSNTHTVSPNVYYSNKRYVVISRFLFVVHPFSHHIIATSQRPTSPYQQIFNHEFYDCKQAMDKIAKIIISNA